MYSESEDKYGDEFTGNRNININNYTKNIETFLVCHICAHQEAL